MVGFGLAIALKRNGISAAMVFLGPHLLQAAAARRVLDRYVRCIDLQYLDEDSFLRALKFAEVGSDLVIVVGNRGYFDQPASDGMVSDKDIADLIAAPAVIVTDGENWGQSLAAVLHGFRDLSHWVQGVVVNRSMHGGSGGFWRDTFKAFGSKFFLGGLPQIDAMRSLPPRLVNDVVNRTLLDRQMLVNLERAIADNVDLSAVFDLAKGAQFVKLKPFSFSMAGRCTRIAVAEDSCFGLCFQDNLDLLRFFGADLVPFSPLADGAMPKGVGALYVPGAFLGEYAKDLSSNTSMMQSIRDFANGGGVVYAEAGGAAYLAAEYEVSDSEICQGVGLFRGRVSVTTPDSVPRCVASEIFDDCLLGVRGEPLKMCSLGNIKFTARDRAPLLAVAEGSSVNEGYVASPNVVLSSGFQQWSSNPAMAQAFVDASLRVAKIRPGAV